MPVLRYPTIASQNPQELGLLFREFRVGLVNIGVGDLRDPFAASHCSNRFLGSVLEHRHVTRSCAEGRTARIDDSWPRFRFLTMRIRRRIGHACPPPLFPISVPPSRAP